MRKIVLIYILTGFYLFSGEVLIIDIDKAITLAENNNIGIKRESLSLEKKSRAKKTAFNVFYPDLTGTAAIAKSNTKPDGASDMNLALIYSASFAFTPALFDAVTLLKKDYELGEISYIQAKKSLDVEVKSIFYNIIVLEEQIRLLEDNLKTMKTRYEQTSLNFNAGLVTELELLKAQVSYENLKPELNNLNNLYNSTIVSFKTMLGVESSVDIKISGEIEPELNSYTYEEAIDMAVKNNLDLNSINKSIEFYAAQKKATFSRNFLPVLSIEYESINRLNDPFGSGRLKADNFADDAGNLTLGLFYSFGALFPQSAERIEIEEIDRSIRDMRLQEESILDGMKLQVTNYIDTLNNSLKIQEGLQLTVLLAEKSLNIIEIAYRSGTAVLLEVENAQNEYKTARLELLKEKYNYINNKLKLEAIILPQ